jgi:hypothetical protein
VNDQAAATNAGAGAHDRREVGRTTHPVRGG